jgi:hypothetical protein
MKPLVCFLLLAPLGACDITSPGGGLRQQVREELATEEANWKAKAVHSYDFDFQRDCTSCPAAVTQQVNIHVRNDVIARVVDAQGLDVAPQSGISWPTVDSLFLWARQLLENSSFSIGLAFDTAYHFPALVHGEQPGFVVEHHSSGMVQQTFSAPIRVGQTYLMAEPLSKSNRVVWRRR